MRSGKPIGQQFFGEADEQHAAQVELWHKLPRMTMLQQYHKPVVLSIAVGAENLGVTLDIGHAILSGERAAQSAAMLARAGRLFYVHVNDNDRNWDWDMLPGAFNFWEFLEFFYFLKEVGYTDDWYSFDVMSKEIDTVETFNAVTYLTRKLEALTERIDRQQMAALMNERNPAKTMRYLYDTVLDS